MSTLSTETLGNPETTVKVSSFPVAALERIKAHAARQGITTEAGALRLAALRGLEALDAEAPARCAAPEPETVA